MNHRRLYVVTTTRADYGLLYWLMREIDEDPELELQLVVTGSHLSTEFGLTVREIENDGFRIHRRIEILLASDTRTAMTRAMGLAMTSFGDALAQDRPDLVVVLGDRFEIVPVALAAVVEGIPVAHLHGGETSRGALDEYFRHAVTKLASIHFVATEAYRRRILQMGENPDLTFNFGAPGLDHLHRTALPNRDALRDALQLPLDQPTAIVTYHPVTGEADGAAEQQIDALLEALEAVDDLFVVFSKANADTQGRMINARLEEWCALFPYRSRLFDNLGHRWYMSCLLHLDLMVGNSSSGLLEAPSFGLPVVNIGRRQEGRIQADNIISVTCDPESIRQGVVRARSVEFRKSLEGMHNPYEGDSKGNVSQAIKDALKKTPLGQSLRIKSFFDLEPFDFLE
ncbi:UDP-N-acetylglucosamine 2-epimerase [Halomonas nitroreducens]|uniref:UDP-N-acetylglucosamine 2-epimerase (Hydrolyzing) n=1 Tax=Halomonas nitroreducens TaxID=447425 RepID=A0A3S0HTT1_9GAMM|nr:UDP-N-acetylglucosamine 2-epimerase [Halomonas nitroreducens]RTR05334.1 UDP-N-acetylglucosamine 2-epimerase (hydrolyzing) [Halomonas nitroreducens]